MQRVDPGRAHLFVLGGSGFDRTRPSYPGALIDEVVGPSPHNLSVRREIVSTVEDLTLMVDTGQAERCS